MITNSNIPLPLAVWLCHDEYDYQVDKDNYISVTELLNPTRSIVLSKRLVPEVDMNALIVPRIGTAIHDSIEAVWRNEESRNKALKALGYPEKMWRNLDIHIEERSYRKIDGYTVGGKFDMIINGNLFDFKSTSVYTWITGGKEEDYQKQGSIYRWLNPSIISSDTVTICFIFTDWNQKDALYKDKYPGSRIMYKEIPLLSMGETERFIRSKLREITANIDRSQDDMIRCTDNELWRGPAIYKYYRSGDISKKATKVSKDISELMQEKSKNGNGGTILVVPGEPRRCRYCVASSICKQKKEMCGEDQYDRFTWS